MVFDESGTTSGGTDDDGATSAEAEGSDEMAGSSADSGVSGGGGSDAPRTTPVNLTPADLGRSIVYTATVELQAADVNAAAAEARQAVAALGGVVFGQQSTSSPQPRTVLVFKVGPDQFQAALDALGPLGDVVRRDVSADDVTERVVDLRSQIASAEVSVARLRDLLSDAGSVEAVAALEGQLLQRETALEQMRGQLRTLEDQVALSTITLTITQPSAAPLLAVATTAYDGVDGSRCPGEDELTLTEGDDATLCVTIANIGNVAVGEIEVRDHRLGIDPDDVTLVAFGADDVLQPDEEVVAWATFVADPDVSPSVDVSAVPLDSGGEQIRVAVRTEATPMALTVDEDTSMPGFADAFGSGLAVLATAFGVAVVAAGLLIPLLVIVVPVAAAIVWWRRRSRGDTMPAPAAR